MAGPVGEPALARVFPCRHNESVRPAPVFRCTRAARGYQV